MNQYLGGAIGILVIFFLVQLLALWRVFEKSGQEGWKTLVPFYNIHTYLQIIGKPSWWLLAMFIPLIIPTYLFWNSNPPVNDLSSFLNQSFMWHLAFFLPIAISMIFIIWSFNMLAKSFGLGKGFTVGLILAGFIFLPLLAFEDYNYLGPYGNKEVFDAHAISNYDLEKKPIRVHAHHK